MDDSVVSPSCVGASTFRLGMGESFSNEEIGRIGGKKQPVQVGRPIPASSLHQYVRKAKPEVTGATCGIQGQGAALGLFCLSKTSLRLIAFAQGGEKGC